MPLAQLADVGVAFGGRRVLDGVSLSLDEGDRVGLVGLNGAGKTTLLRLFAGALSPDVGRVSLKRGLRTGFLEQEPVLPDEATVHDVALSAFDDVMEIERRMRAVEHDLAAAADRRDALMKELGRLQERFDHANGYECESRTAATLMGLGFHEHEFSRPVRLLSGGERSRLCLVRLLLRDAELLLLDEPTNHLDLAGIEWLETFLNKKFRGAVLLVSHDRMFLDRTVTSILEIERAQIASYPGNYSQYVLLKEERTLEQQRAYEKQQEFIAKEEDFYRRYHAAQRGREARGRLKRLNRLERIEAPQRVRGMHLRFAGRRDPSDVCLRAERIAKAYGPETLFRGLDLEIYRGERIGIIGPNGAGKTTLLRTLLRTLEPDAGRVILGRNAVAGYLPQQITDAAPDRTVLDEVWERRRTWDEVAIRNVLGRFLFSGDDDVHKPLRALSGGERKRIAFACLLVDQPNVLFLDEPTNHLDIASREALEAALEDYEGTIIAVSHDRYFLNRIVDRLVVMEGADTRVFLGSYSDYEAAREAAAGAPPRPALPAKESPKPPSPPKTKPKRSKNRQAALEKEISALESEKAALETALGDPALYADPEKSRAVPQRYQEVARRLDALYAEWADDEG